MSLSIGRSHIPVPTSKSKFNPEMPLPSQESEPKRDTQSGHSEKPLGHKGSIDGPAAISEAEIEPNQVLFTKTGKPKPETVSTVTRISNTGQAGAVIPTASDTLEDNPIQVAQGPYTSLRSPTFKPALSLLHQEIAKRADKIAVHGATRWSDMNGIAYALGGQKAEYVEGVKKQWVQDYRDVIKDAAQRFHISPELLGCVLYKEVGGAPPSLDGAVLYAREQLQANPMLQNIVPDMGQGKFNLKTQLVERQPDQTSFGDPSIQIQAAARELGYDPEALGPELQGEIVKSLQDPKQAIYIAAKHLQTLEHDLKHRLIQPGVFDKLPKLQQMQLVANLYNVGEAIFCRQVNSANKENSDQKQQRTSESEESASIRPPFSQHQIQELLDGNNKFYGHTALEALANVRQLLAGKHLPGMRGDLPMPGPRPIPPPDNSPPLPRPQPAPPPK
jgi:hypothetical protein